MAREVDLADVVGRIADDLAALSAMTHPPATDFAKRVACRATARRLLALGDALVHVSPTDLRDELAGSCR